jgi:Flp pilus assembly pilin Flp
MATLMTRIRALANGQEGQDLIEYALLAGLISVVAVATVTAAGGEVRAFFTNRVTTKLGEINR